MFIDKEKMLDTENFSYLVENMIQIIRKQKNEI